MPASRRSHLLTEAYRRRLVALADRVKRAGEQAWPPIEGLDTTVWPEAMAQAVTRAQIEGVRLTAAYLGAFLRAETGSGRVPTLPRDKYAGLSRDGRPLSESLLSPIIGVRAALKNDRTPEDALRLGLQRATRTVAFEAMQTPRDALLDAIEQDDRIEGWERAVEGTCAACMALSGLSGPQFEVHPGCECIPTPKVVGVRDLFPLPTGAALFKALSKPEQNAKLGAEAAQLVRDGEADLKDFVAHSKLESDQADFITQKPVENVAT